MLLPLIAIAAAAAPDTWRSPRTLVSVSEEGRHAVVVQPVGWKGARFTWVAQHPDLSAPNGAAIEVDVQELLSAKQFHRPKLLKHGTMSQIPTKVLVSDKGHGFVALGRHGGNRQGKTLMTFDSKGTLQGSWSIEDIERIGGKDGYTGSVTIVSWCRGYWIDEETGEAVMTSTLDQVFVAPLDASELRMGGVPELKRALLQGGDEKQQMALDALTLHDCPELVPEYTKLTAVKYPIATRLRAGRALRKLGKKVAGPLVMDVALREGPSEEVTLGDIIFALEDLHHYADAEAVMVLKDRLVPENRYLIRARTKALGQYGPQSAPLLVEMLQDLDAPLHLRQAAATALGEAGDASSLDALMHATQDPNKELALNALRSMASIGGEDVAERLLPLLGTRSHFTGFLLYYYSNHRHPSAKPELEAFLATKEPKWLRERIEKAIRFQSGESEDAPPAQPSKDVDK